MGVVADILLTDRLAEALPQNIGFQFHHLSSPPTPCAAIYAAPPGEKQEKTFCESHFLSVSIDSKGQQLHIFALEALLYTTKILTTLFVSKADSTGYLHLLNLPKAFPSPLQTISTTFLAYLVEKRQRPDRKLVLSLFARAQDQYLFPGSIENPGKHVLDDRALVRWWCRVVDPILKSHTVDDDTLSGNIDSSVRRKPQTCQKDSRKLSAKGYLRVPGCDSFEIRSFFASRSKEPTPDPCWRVGDPLRDFGRSPHWPERCLIPRFPDDPKARYVDELDDELSEPALQTQESPSKGKHPGQWKSVKSLEQFWEMIAFRQECSSGRLVGFVWGVFTPSSEAYDNEAGGLESSLDALRQQRIRPIAATSAPSHGRDSTASKRELAIRLNSVPVLPPPSSPSNSSTKEKREPRVAKSLPEMTEYYYWPVSSRGEVVLRQKDYHRVNKLMLHLDYADKDIAARSTKRWVSDISVMAGKSWGQIVIGKRQPKKVCHASKPNAATLDAGLVRKKKREFQDLNGKTPPAALDSKKNGVNVLSMGLVRKKPKVTNESYSQEAPD